MSLAQGELRDASVAARSLPDELWAEVCIVGSGCAGGTAAAVLAAAGWDVLVLEEGADYRGSQFTGRDVPMYDQLYMDRGGRMTDDLTVAVLQGRVLGGGGVVNACDVTPLSDEVLEFWRARHGLGELTPAALEPYRAQALADLSANVPRDDEQNRNNQLLAQGASALGWRGEKMLHNRVGCAGVGTCLIGCPLDAKRNPRTVALPRALSAGARILTRARAVRVLEKGPRDCRVSVRTLDRLGYREVGALTVRCKRVILAANGIASAQLLLRSGLGNAHVGRHLMLQPQLPITARFAEPVRFFRGIPQSFAVTQFEEPASAARGWGGFRIEAIGGTPGIVATLLPESGEAGKALMQQYPNLAASLLLTPDEPQGHLEVERSGRMRIHYGFTEPQRALFRRAARAAARLYFEAGAQEVMVPTVPLLRLGGTRELARLDEPSFAPATVGVLSAHQMGTVRFSGLHGEGAAAPDGRVLGTLGVYVFDSSLFPSSAASHLMAPIITLARYLSERLLSERR
jgi:choline dehydrogenase-like flavoprotein